MNLLIFPGGGNPDASPLFKSVYNLIKREALRFGYNHVFTELRWPAHTSEESYESAPSLSLTDAIKVAECSVRSLPDEPYSILARSFGCIVALKMANAQAFGQKTPEKIILWGPVPYWVAWKMFSKDLDIAKLEGKCKGVKIDHSYFETLVPVETLIGGMQIPTVVASGSADKYCTPDYITYLRKLCKNNIHIKFTGPVHGASHEVTDAEGLEVVKKYAEALFHPKNGETDKSNN